MNAGSSEALRRKNIGEFKSFFPAKLFALNSNIGNGYKTFTDTEEESKCTTRDSNFITLPIEFSQEGENKLNKRSKVENSFHTLKLFYKSIREKMGAYTKKTTEEAGSATQLRCNNSNEGIRPFGVLPKGDITCREATSTSNYSGGSLAKDESNDNQKLKQSEVSTTDDLDVLKIDMRKPKVGFLKSVNLAYNENKLNGKPDKNFIDTLFSSLEHLHDRMELVRNGIQQLLDHFTLSRQSRVEEQECVLQFKYSIQMLQKSIEYFNYFIYGLPTTVTSRKSLLLPTKNTLLELNEQLQSLSVDLEHTQYFNNESPMLTMFKMIVVINLIANVLKRGKNNFTNLLLFDESTEGLERFSIDIKYEHYRFIRPTYDILRGRLEGMIQLKNIAGVLHNSWTENFDWQRFLPQLQMFMRAINAVDPLFRVPDNWYIIRIVPETHLMHIFDGFMSEFYRAIVTPDFAQQNPEAFAAIFTVLRFILNNLINQHIAIVRDLECMLKQLHTESLPNDYSSLAEPENFYCETYKLLANKEVRGNYENC